MHWLITSNCSRYTHLPALLCQQGHTVHPLPPQPHEQDWQQAFADCDLLLLPIPTPPGPVAPGWPGVSVLVRAVKPGSIVVGGWPGQPPHRQEEGVQIINLLAMPLFKQLNALPTAEGALCRALAEGGRVLNNSRCLLTGSGQIAQALLPRLASLGAQVTVWARRPGQLPAGTPCLGEDWQPYAPYDFIFNTIPAQVIPTGLLALQTAQCLYCELASAPFGAPPEAFDALPLRRLYLPGLPSMFPHTAAEITATCIGQALDELGLTLPDGCALHG